MLGKQFVLKSTLLMTLTIGLLVNAHGQTHTPWELDIFGTNQLSVDKIKKAHGDIFQFVADGLNNPTDDNLKKIEVKVAKFKKHLKQSLHDVKPFHINVVKYPDQSTIYFTIDIVENKNKERYAYFNPKPKQHIADPDGLVKKWQAYESVANEIFVKRNRFPNYSHCPFFHCVWGFEAPQLQKYEKVFKEGVPKHVKQLVAILRKDKDPHKRASAAYLLGHMKDGNRLAKVLVPSMRDPDDGVRNSAMRTLAGLLMKKKIKNFPIEEVILALDYPEESDRNKSLFMLVGLIKQPKFAKYAAKYGSHSLVKQLRLKQPNLHNIAYGILKNISGKHYGEHDYQAWQAWANRVSAHQKA